MNLEEGLSIRQGKACGLRGRTASNVKPWKDATLPPLERKVGWLLHA